MEERHARVGGDCDEGRRDGTGVKGRVRGLHDNSASRCGTNLKARECLPPLVQQRGGGGRAVLAAHCTHTVHIARQQGDSQNTDLSRQLMRQLDYHSVQQRPAAGGTGKATQGRQKPGLRH